MRTSANGYLIIGTLAVMSCLFDVAEMPIGADVAYAGTPSNWTGSLKADTTWTKAESPCRVTGELVVPRGITLTIMPGTTVFFDAKARIVIRGCLIAEGTQSELIRFTRTQGSAATWNGLQLVDTTSENHISYALLEYARTDEGMVGLQNSNLLIDHVTMDHCDRRRIRTIDSSLIVRNCIFADIFGPTEPPSTDNMSEHIWGSGVPKDGHFIIENNIFGTTKGHNDAVDFDGPSRPLPIPLIRGNVFMGSGDDALDLECDADVENNVFMNFVRDRYNTASGESNVISAGAGKHYVMVRNIMYNAQHVAQVKDDSFLTFVNNTVVNVSGAAIYFELGLPGRKPGRGASVGNCIFWNTPVVFAGIKETTDIAAGYSVLPTQWHYLGGGNLDVDPLFADPNNRDYHPKSQASRWDSKNQKWVKDDVTSPCIDAGDPNSPIGFEPFPNGGRINMGTYGGTVEASKSYFGGPICETIVAGDINGDCKVDFRDFALMAFHWLDDYHSP